MIEHSGSIDDLPSDKVEFGVTHIEILSGKGIGLNIQIGVSNIVDETGLTNVGESCDEESSFERVDSWNSG